MDLAQEQDLVVNFLLFKPKLELLNPLVILILQTNHHTQNYVHLLDYHRSLHYANDDSLVKISYNIINSILQWLSYILQSVRPYYRSSIELQVVHNLLPLLL